MKSFMCSSCRLLLALPLALSAQSLFAQSTVYSAGETDSTALSSTGNITLEVDSGTATQAGAISGTGTVVKDGAGTLIFTGNNTYAGAGSGTTVAVGTLQIGNGGSSGSFGTTALIIETGATLAFDLNNSFTDSKAIAGLGGAMTGTIVQNGSGTVTLSKAVAASAIVVNSGSLVLGGSTQVTTATVNGGTLTLAAPGASANGFGSMVVAGGTLSTSTTASTVALAGNLTLNSGTITTFGSTTGSLTLASGKSFTMTGGTLDFGLGTSFNQLISAGSGALTLNGGTLSLNTSGAGFSYSDTYQLFSGFSNTSYSALALTGYDTSLYSASISENGTLSFSAVPEPASYAAFAGAAALGMAVWQRRKRQAA